MAMNTLVVLEIFHLFFIRNLHGSSFDLKILRATPVVWTVVLIVTAAQLIVTQYTLFQRLLGTETVATLDCLLIMAVGVGFFVIIEIEKQIRMSLKRRLERVSWRNRSAQA